MSYLPLTLLLFGCATVNPPTVEDCMREVKAKLQLSEADATHLEFAIFVLCKRAGNVSDVVVEQVNSQGKK